MRQKVTPDIATVLGGGAPLAFGSYGPAVIVLHRALQKHPVKGMRILVVGSENPWLESLLLAYGASKICRELALVSSLVPEEPDSSRFH